MPTAERRRKEKARLKELRIARGELESADDPYAEPHFEVDKSDQIPVLEREKLTKPLDLYLQMPEEDYPEVVKQFDATFYDISKFK